ANRALQAGLVSEVCPTELTVKRAIEIAQTIASKAPIAVRFIKEAVYKANDTDLATGLRFERHAFTILAGTADRAEGLKAFQEKRQPLFKGQ
ncbi:MAG TPA: enoyl-CoA hydratase-related protein, partial [Thiopseudomonas sp.]|nr:enoyl-CoA hydratase-related protein [Thiopseudomonas sp.]